MTFSERKRQCLEKLQKAKSEKKVDVAIIDLLDTINASEDYYTSSSCSGRIILLEVVAPSFKQDAVFLFKSHKEISLEEIKNGINLHTSNQLWLMVEPPILHIGTRTLDAAKKMLTLSYAAGFKRSNIKSIGNKIIVEIMSSEEVHIPLGHDQMILVDDKYLEYVVALSNTIFKKGASRLMKLKTIIREEI